MRGAKVKIFGQFPGRIRFFGTLPLLLAVICLAGVMPAISYGAADVLILDSTVVGGTASWEAKKAVELGLSVEVVNADGWAAKTKADFAQYKAIILGDPQCSGDLVSVAAADANKNVWGPAVTGNVIIIGADPSYHAALSVPGALQLIYNGIKFAASEAGKTGAYITLSCYYVEAGPGTPVPFLDGLGSFATVGLGGKDNIHIVATNPALSGLTDALLSNWGSSTHESFQSWPLDFLVLAVALDGPPDYTAPDGSVGAPYILARGVTVISDIKLSPESISAKPGTDVTLTATVTEGGTPAIVPERRAPVPDKTVTFKIISGPNAGTTGTGVTNTEGKATFTYTSAVAGVDIMEASFVDSQERIQTSNRATINWGDLIITTSSLPSGKVGASYSTTLSASGGTPPYTWSISKKTASPGLFDKLTETEIQQILANLIIDPVTGVLKWDPLPKIPENPDKTNPIYYIDFTVTVMDSQERTAPAVFRYTDPEVGTASGSAGAGGFCFIATAAYGSYLHPDVKVLREFRDRYLLSNYPGRLFVETYYRISPPIAVFIGRHEALRTMVRYALTPVVYGIKYSGMACIILGCSAGSLIYRRRRKAKKVKV
jgi:hypothetical protein